MNIIQIAGHLGADPETRFTPSGQKVTQLRVATRTRKKGGKQNREQQNREQNEERGEDQRDDDTIWWRVTIWGERFDKMMPFLKKGSAIIVIGELHKPEIWTNRDGQPQVTLELTAEMIRFSPFGKSERSEQSSYQPHQSTQQSYGSYSPQQAQMGSQSIYGSAPASSNLDEDPPF